MESGRNPVEETVGILTTKTRFLPKMSSSRALPESIKTLFKDRWKAFTSPFHLVPTLSSLYFVRFPMSITEYCI